MAKYSPQRLSPHSAIALEDLHHGVGGGAEGQPGQGALIQLERVPDEADQAASVDVVAKLVQQVPDLRYSRLNFRWIVYREL